MHVRTVPGHRALPEKSFFSSFEFAPCLFVCMSKCASSEKGIVCLYISEVQAGLFWIHSISLQLIIGLTAPWGPG